VKKNISFPLLMFALALQAIGLGLLSQVDITTGIPARFYGFATIIGVGFGLSLPTVSLIARAEVSHLDHSVAMAAISALRSLGGTVGVSLGRIILHTGLIRSLAKVLTPAQVQTLGSSPEDVLAAGNTDFTPTELNLISKAFDSRFNTINLVNMGVAIGALAVGVWAFRRHPVSIQEMDERESKEKERLDNEALGLKPLKLGTEPLGESEGGKMEETKPEQGKEIQQPEPVAWGEGVKRWASIRSVRSLAPALPSFDFEEYPQRWQW
jgi:hypothetical protein